MLGPQSPSGGGDAGLPRAGSEQGSGTTVLFARPGRGLRKYWLFIQLRELCKHEAKLVLGYFVENTYFAHS